MTSKSIDAALAAAPKWDFTDDVYFARSTGQWYINTYYAAPGDKDRERVVTMPKRIDEREVRVWVVQALQHYGVPFVGADIALGLDILKGRLSK